MGTRGGRFVRSVITGYAVLGANAIYSIASVPLALHYLPQDEFGLWGLTSQISGFLALIDLGMSTALSRNLIDHKDDLSSGRYGAAISTGSLVLLSQCLIVLCLGLLFVKIGVPRMNLPGPLRTEFHLLMLIQTVITAIGFLPRMFGYVLVAHQRYDLLNHAQIAQLAAGFAALWIAFKLDAGVFSVAWSNGVALLVGSLLPAFSAIQKRLFPPRESWGRPSWPLFRELFAFGRDVFWMSLGSQLIMASQTVIITQTIGVNAVATWTVCTRPFTLVIQMIWRVFDVAFPGFSEMIVRNEQKLLFRRFKSLVIFTLSLAAFMAVLFAACNRDFVELWTRGRVGWESRNDVLLALWLLPLCTARCHCSFVQITKQIGAMRFIYFIEGVAFALLAIVVARWGGFSALIASSIFCGILFSSSYGIWRTSRYFRIPVREVVSWLRPMVTVLLLLSAPAAALHWTGRSLPTWAHFTLTASVLLTIGIPVLWRFGVDRDLAAEISARIPLALQPLAAKLRGRA